MPYVIPPFVGFTQFTPAVPKLYWNVKSQEQRIKALCEELHKLIVYSETIKDQTNINTEDIEKLKADYQYLIEYGFDEYFADDIERWINENMQSIISIAIKMVFFGLTKDGYFCAYIPDSWEGIIFDTIMDYADNNYGCLTLAY